MFYTCIWCIISVKLFIKYLIHPSIWCTKMVSHKIAPMGEYNMCVALAMVTTTVICNINNNTSDTVNSYMYMSKQIVAHTHSVRAILENRVMQIAQFTNIMRTQRFFLFVNNARILLAIIRVENQWNTLNQNRMGINWNWLTHCKSCFFILNCCCSIQLRKESMRHCLLNVVNNKQMEDVHIHTHCCKQTQLKEDILWVTFLILRNF